ncbi:MAG: phosphonate ABC transporter ATP-binding protein [Burkholderiales bacterium]|nr:phosphonate ABC transporter ATP-binding protein [Burkholderiales bacterium]
MDDIGQGGRARGAVATARALLAIEALEKVYAGGQRALDGISFSVERPEVIAIIGTSGAGKSTLIRCVNRLVEPTAGRVWLGDTDVVALSRRDLRRARRRIGMIFQEFNLVERLTVMENVLSGRLGSVGFMASFLRRFPPQDVSGAFALLDRVGLAGYHDTRADALSGGQRQRVGIARALMQNPDLLLVDEPTASLDPKTARQIMRLICALAVERNTPALVNMHDVALAQAFANRVIGLKAGRVVFDGPPEALTAEVLTEIYGAEDWSQTIRRVTEDDAEE